MNHQFAELTGLAIDAIRTILTNADTPPSVRLRAARLILDSTRADTGRTAMETAAPIQSADTPTAPTAAPNKTGRNETCPCGSGLKFKRCCLGKSTRPARPGLTPDGRPAPPAREEPPAAAA